MVGTSDNDTIIGDGEKLIGGAGDDTIILNSGDNKAIGGSGDDTFIYMFGNHLGTGSANTIEGSSGVNTLVINLNGVENALPIAQALYIAYQSYLASQSSEPIDLIQASNLGGLIDDPNMSLIVHNVDTLQFTPIVGEQTLGVLENTLGDTGQYVQAYDPGGADFTYELVSGGDGLFEINNTTGELSLLESLDFETEPNTYDLTVKVTNSFGFDTTATVTVNEIDDPNPVFQTPAEAAIPENTVDVTTVEAVDPLGQVVTFSLSGGEDQALFSITPGGKLSFNSPPDYENPTDASLDNIYEVQVTATDSAGETSALDMKVTVEDVAEGPRTIYVDHTATGGLNDGTSWENAYTDLHQALGDAKPNEQIWVAGGTYTPIDGIEPGDLPTDSTLVRDISFMMPQGAFVYGGFSGWDGGSGAQESSLEERDWRVNKTLLSGDIAFGGQSAELSPNSFHVVIGADNATLDGFVVTQGNADVFSTSSLGLNRYWGGGLYLTNGRGENFQINNVVFFENTARHGGGLHSGHVSVSITNSFFISNDGGDGGGAGVIRTYQNDVVNVENTVFHQNSANGFGGALFLDMNQPTTADAGINIVNSVFSSNTVSWLDGTVFWFNSSSQSRLDISNSIFWGNTTGSSYGVSLYGQMTGLEVNLSNNIFPYDYDASQNVYAPGSAVNGADNIAGNPLFIGGDLDGLDDILGTGDDYWALQDGSPAINAGTLVDAPEYDITGSYRGTDVDIGAYENTVANIYVAPETEINIDFSAVMNAGNILQVDMSQNTVSQTLTIAASDVLAEAPNGLLVKGTSAADQVISSETWSSAGTQTIGGMEYSVYEASVGSETARLFIEPGIDVSGLLD